jgi:hypothetical protein
VGNRRDEPKNKHDYVKKNVKTNALPDMPEVQKSLKKHSGHETGKHG